MPEDIVAPKIASVGKPIPMKFNPTSGSVVDKVEDAEANKGGAQSGKPAGFSPEEFNQYLKENGIEVTSIDDLKKKLNPEKKPVTKPEPTKEEQEIARQQREKRMMDKYLSGGGKVEDYVYLKQVSSSDVAQLSDDQLKFELKQAGFNDEEIGVLIKERYYQQLTDEDIDGVEDEKEKEFLKKKKKWATEKLTTRSSHIKSKAESILQDLDKAITSEDEQAQLESQYSDKVSDVISKLPRKLTFELGLVDDQKIDPITYDVSEESIAEIEGLLKDPEKRNKFFYNDDDTLNAETLANVMLRNNILESALKVALLSGQTSQVDAVSKVFPQRSPQEIGLRGASSNQGTKGKIVSVGKPQLVKRQQS